jgi:hypothetical protein
MKKEDLDIYTEKEAERMLIDAGEDIYTCPAEDEDLEPANRRIDSTTVADEMINRGYQSIILQESQTLIFIKES